MKISIPKVIVPVDLGGYADELRGQALNVWVNMPLNVLELHTRILNSESETKGEDLRAWYAAIWSEGAEDTRWTADELRELEAQDPALMGWMIAETWQARREHIDRRKKA